MGFYLPPIFSRDDEFKKLNFIMETLIIRPIIPRRGFSSNLKAHQHLENLGTSEKMA